MTKLLIPSQIQKKRYTKVAMMSYERWLQLMKNLGLDENRETYDALVAVYLESHRYYHDQSHINAVLVYLDSFSAIAENKSEIELALWFHDAIYKPFSSSNEVDSADWAWTFLDQNSTSRKSQKNVYNLIMATSHIHIPNNDDEKLITDIDLAILGSAEDCYSQFTIDVRKEYKRVPDCIYKRKRKTILKGFLNRDRIYSTNKFHDKFEVQARANLSRELNQYTI